MSKAQRPAQESGEYPTIDPGAAQEAPGAIPFDRVLASSCAYFASAVLTGDPKPPYYGKFLLGDHHLQWDALLLEHDRLCVLAARDHGKSWFFSYAYPIWQAIRWPGELGYIFSATQEQASRILEIIKLEIEHNPQLSYLEPNKLNQTRTGKRWSSRNIMLSNGSRIAARGFGTRVRGGHPRWLVADDVLNDDSLWSASTRRKQTEYFYSALSNLVVPGGQLLVVGTPFFETDLYGDLSKNTRYKFCSFPALDDNGNPLWPARYSARGLAEKQAEIGSVRFTREFLCSPVSDEMSLFPAALFKGSPVEQYQVWLGLPRSWWRAQGVGMVYMGVDFALSSSTAADYTVIWTVGVDDSGNRWILDIAREKGMPYGEQKSLIVQLARKYQADLVVLEANQAQRIFGDELMRETDLPIMQYTTGVEKHALDKGIPSLRVLLENKKYRIPRGDAHAVKMTDLWISEMRSFAFAEGKVQSVAQHDDLVLGCWLAEQGIRKSAFGFTFGEGEAASTKEEIAQLEAELLGYPEKERAEEDKETDRLALERLGVAPEVQDEQGNKQAPLTALDWDEDEETEAPPVHRKLWSARGFRG